MGRVWFFLFPPNIITKYFAVGQLLVPDQTVVKKRVNNPLKPSNAPGTTKNPESKAPTPTSPQELKARIVI